MNIEQLKQKRSEIKDRKSTEYKTCTLLLGEAETIFKRSGEEPDITAIAAKMIKSNNEVLMVRPSKELVEENIFLLTFLPKQMTVEELTTAINESKESNVGGVMKYLNTNYAGKFDRKLASQLAKSLI